MTGVQTCALPICPDCKRGFFDMLKSRSDNSSNTRFIETLDLHYHSPSDSRQEQVGTIRYLSCSGGWIVNASVLLFRSLSLALIWIVMSQTDKIIPYVMQYVLCCSKELVVIDNRM